MIDTGYIVIIGAFVLYYFILLVFEKKLLSDPREIFDKFLAFTLLYAGISIIYYSMTGTPLFNDSEGSYTIYLFIIGAIAIMWTIPTIFEDFEFYQNFVDTSHQRRERRKLKAKAKTKKAVKRKRK